MIIEGTNRKERYESVIANLSNYLEPCEPPIRKFIAVEQSHDTYVWAMTSDSLDDLQEQIDQSETEVEDVKVFDLDTGLFHPVTFISHISPVGYEV